MENKTDKLSEEDKISLQSGSAAKQPEYDIDDIDSEAPLSQFLSYSSTSTYAGLVAELFMQSQAASEHLVSPEFTELIMKFNQLVEEEEARTEEAAPDLEAEDDAGNTEYKLKMCDLTMYKVKKRTTQMAFRLTEGKGLAFYEVGVHDNGELVGIEYEECVSTILVLFHMSRTLEADLDVILVRLGYEGYSVQLRVTKPQPEAIEPEVDAFISGLNLLGKSRIYESLRTIPDQQDVVSKAPATIIQNRAEATKKLIPCDDVEVQPECRKESESDEDENEPPVESLFDQEESVPTKEQTIELPNSEDIAAAEGSSSPSPRASTRSGNNVDVINPEQENSAILSKQ